MKASTTAGAALTHAQAAHGRVTMDIASAETSLAKMLADIKAADDPARKAKISAVAGAVEEGVRAANALRINVQSLICTLMGLPPDARVELDHNEAALLANTKGWSDPL